MKKLLAAILVSLSVSAPALAETEIDRLLAASREISAQVKSAQYSIAGSVHYAGVGGVVTTGAVTQYSISEQQMDAYNGALNDVKSAVYYNTKMFFEDKHEEAMENLSHAVDVFAVAAQEIAKVDAVAEVAENADTVEDQVALQEFVAAEDVELTQQDIGAYNDSLGDVEQHSQEAAAFLQAANSAFVVEKGEQHSQEFNSNATQMTATYTATNDTLNLMWAADQFISFHGFFANDFVNSAEVLGMGQTIYEEQATLQ